MPHLTDEIDEGATRRRLEDITASGMHALEQCAERSAEIDEQGRESIARQEAEIKAMEEARDAAKAANAEAAEEKQPPPSPWGRREAKPTVLSFDGEDFAGEAPATAPIPAPGVLPSPAAALPVPLPPEPPTPPTGERVPTFSLGFEDEGPGRADPPTPAARRPERPPAPEDDDDLSGHSWMK